MQTSTRNLGTHFGLFLAPFAENHPKLAKKVGITSFLFTETRPFTDKTSSGAIKTACNIQIDGKLGPGQLKMSWKT